MNEQEKLIYKSGLSEHTSSLLISIKTNQGLFILPTLEIKISCGQRTIYCFTELMLKKNLAFNNAQFIKKEK